MSRRRACRPHTDNRLASRTGRLLATAIVIALVAAGPAAAHAQAAGDDAWVLSSSKFTNEVTSAPYVGNGYIGARIPAAGTGLVAGQGINGWPTYADRLTTSIAAGVYAQAPGPYGNMQATADIPTWSTLTFGSAAGSYSTQTASSANVSDYRQSLDLRTGQVTTSGVWTSLAGERARFALRVFTDRARAHVAVVRLDLTPEWTGRRSGRSGRARDRR